MRKSSRAKARKVAIAALAPNSWDTWSDSASSSGNGRLEEHDTSSSTIDLRTTLSPSQSQHDETTTGYPRAKQLRRGSSGSTWTTSTGGSKVKEESFRFRVSLREDHQSAVFGCSFNPYLRPNSQVLCASCGHKRVTIYQCQQEVPWLTPLIAFSDCQETDDRFYCLSWLYDTLNQEHLLAVAGQKGLIRIITPSKGCRRTLIGHGQAINDLRTHPHYSMLLISAGKENMVLLWDVASGSSLASFRGIEGHRDQVLSCDFTLDGRHILSAGMDHAVKLWSLEEVLDDSGQRQVNSTRLVDYPAAHTRDVHSDYVDCVRSYGNFIASKSCGDSISIWKFGDLDEEENDSNRPPLGRDRCETAVSRLAELELPDSSVWFMKFAIDPSFELLAAGNCAGSIYIWELPPKGDLLSPRAEVLKRHNCNSTIRQLDFSPNSQILFAVCDDGTVWRWDRTSMSK